MSHIIFSVGVSLLATLVLSQFAKAKYMYHIIIGMIIGMIIVVYGSFGVDGGIMFGLLIAFGVSSLLAALGRGFNKYYINTFGTIAIIIFGATFII